MNFIEMNIEEIMLLDIEMFYIFHPEGEIETCKVISNKLHYLREGTSDNEGISWENWGPFGPDSPKESIECYKKIYKDIKLFIHNKE